MKRTILLFATMACMTITSLPAQEAAVNKIIETGRSDNQVMNHLDILTNRFGGRPIGSDAYDNATEWVASKFKEWGLEVELQEAGTLPVGFNRGPWFGKLLGDVGLLCAACMENVQFDLLMGNVDVNMGSILENAFAQNLQAGGFHLNYYDSKKIGELDFVLQRGLSVELVEVKSGNDYHKHKALDRALQVENWKFKESVVFSKGNIESENGITYLPWYMVIFFHQEKEPDQMIYEIDLSDL